MMKEDSIQEWLVDRAVDLLFFSVEILGIIVAITIIPAYTGKRELFYRTTPFRPSQCGVKYAKARPILAPIQ